MVKSKVLESLLQSGVLGDQRVFRVMLSNGIITDSQLIRIAEEAGIFSLTDYVSQLKENIANAVRAISSAIDCDSVKESIDDLKDVAYPVSNAIAESTVVTTDDDDYEQPVIIG